MRPEGAYGESVGIPYLEMSIAKGAAAGVARFYRSVMGAPAVVEDGSARVNVGPGQSIVFLEGEGSEAEYDGHHLAIYVADFSGPYRALAERGLVTREDNPYQFRFIDIVAPRGRKVLFSIEHEVRSLHHPLYGRPLVKPHGGRTTAVRRALFPASPEHTSRIEVARHADRFVEGGRACGCLPGSDSRPVGA